MYTIYTTYDSDGNIVDEDHFSAKGLSFRCVVTDATGKQIESESAMVQ